MILTQVNPVYSTNPAQNAIQVIEWRTYKDPDTNKVYTESRNYTITLYNNTGVETTYTNKSNIDIMV
jgi:hypothetical protein